MKKLLDSYKFSIRHLLIWAVSLSSLVFQIISISALVLFLERKPSLLQLCFAFAIGICVGSFFQISLIFSPFIENMRSNLLRIISIIMMLPSLVFCYLVLTKGVNINYSLSNLDFIGIAIWIGVIGVVAVYLLEIIILLKSVKFEDKIELKIN